MIVIGVDVHKQSLTAVAVDELGRAVAEVTVGTSGELVAWSSSLAPERLWAVEDCRQLTGRAGAAAACCGRVVGASEADGAPSGAPGVRAASPIRSTRSPSLEPPCASRTWIGPGPVRRRCLS
jgi:hypothetical protein